jgi:transposase-like protein
MRPSGSPKTLARRRRLAVALWVQGLNWRKVARRVHVSARSVYQWRQTWRTGGAAALAPKLAPVQLRHVQAVDGAYCLRILLRHLRRQCHSALALWLDSPGPCP